jgi:hypothetical protein
MGFFDELILEALKDGSPRTFPALLGQVGLAIHSTTSPRTVDCQKTGHQTENEGKWVQKTQVHVSNTTSQQEACDKRI